MFDITEFSAIINPPQCGILAIGSGRPIIGEFFLFIKNIYINYFKLNTFLK
jgi:hypothetical protein